MMRVRVKSPYSRPRQRGVEVALYDVACDNGHWSGAVYDEKYVKKLRSIYITSPHGGRWARESNFLVQLYGGGAWFAAIFNGERLSWVDTI